ncbi:GAMMACAL1 [Scenedesmus sp. PABB004]|nr:GAMMACAL1 [Scenedesmus sp. PABB004]
MQRAGRLLRLCQGGPVGGLAPAQAACGLGSAGQVRAFESVAPAVTNKDISEEWYLRQRVQLSLGNRLPHVAASVWISPSAVVAGDVDLLDRVSVWNNVVLRGDLNNITVGHVTNIQDRTVIHAARTSPTGMSAAVKIGKFVTIEPNCALRSCRIGDYAKVGARSVLLEGSMMESHSVLAPGSVLPPTRRVPEGELWGGVPARFIRALSDDEKEALKEEADDIRRLAWQQCAEELPVGTAWRSVEEYRAACLAEGFGDTIPMRREKYDARREAEAAAANVLSGGSGSTAINSRPAMDLLKPLLSGRPLSAAVLEAVGRPLDLLYARLGGLNARFFERGWGNLGIVDLQQDIDMISDWPPQPMHINWRLLQSGSWEGAPYKLYEGSFRTPCVNRIYDALPEESRVGRVQLLVPAPGAPRGGAARAAPLFEQPHTSAAVLHLAATGDHGFARRLRLGGPLLQQGVCQLVHESPYYGARRPAAQRGSKLCAVSDLLALGWATIYESLCLLHWLEQEGVEQRGICGLSMGGVHAAMTAGLYPLPLAITPLLTPRSAAVAYCDGALAPLMAWHALLTEHDWADNEVERVVAAASQPVSLLQQARYVRLQQQEQERAVKSQQALEDAAAAADEAVAAAQQAAALAAVSEAADAEQAAADHRDAAHAAHEVQAAPQAAPQRRQEPQQRAAAQRPAESDDGSWRRQVWRRQVQPAVRALVDPADVPPPDTFRRLRHVLETYTDVTRYPRPVRPDAAVMVAARDDGYVDIASVQALQAHWPGSELRLVSGGHVSAFLMHHDAFRGAMRDSLARLAAPPAAAGDAGVAAPSANGREAAPLGKIS